MYTFKVTDSKDSKKVMKDGLTADRCLMGGESVLSALKTIRKQDGSCFVRLDKDFMNAAEKTNITVGSYDSKRENIVVIRGYDKTKIKVKTFYENGHSVSDVTKVPGYAMESLILDCSKEESIRDLAERGLVNTKQTGYVFKEDGVLVYNHVNSGDVFAILEPIHIDALYALMADYGVTDNNVTAFVNMVMPFITKRVKDYGFTKSEEVLFKAMYVDNKNLTTVLREIVKQNNISVDMIRLADDKVVTMPDLTKDLVIMSYEDDFDLLNVISYLKNKKRIILEKIFKKCGFTVSSIRLVEDELNISRLGRTFHDRDVTISYNGVDLIIPKQVHVTSTTSFNGFNNIPTALMSGDTDMLLDNKYALDAAYLEESNIKKDLKKTPNN